MKTKAISKFGIIFAVALTMVTTAVFTACNSEDDFGGDFNGDITGQYSLATRMMTRAGENNEDSDEEENTGHVVLCKTISETINTTSEDGYNINATAYYIIKVYEDYKINQSATSEEDRVIYFYYPEIEYLDGHSPFMEVEISNFNMNSNEMYADVEVKHSVFYWPIASFEATYIYYTDYHITLSDE